MAPTDFSQRKTIQLASGFSSSLAGALLLLLCACQTVPRLAPVNFAEPGWKVQQGQALWKPSRTAPELAGELLVAHHLDGRALLQFTKTPFPFVIAQTTDNPKRWQIEIPPQNKIYSGPGNPPARLSWLQLAAALREKPLAKKWRFEKFPDGRWHLENQSSGESIEGFLE